MLEDLSRQRVGFLQLIDSDDPEGIVVGRDGVIADVHLLQDPLGPERDARLVEGDGSFRLDDHVLRRMVEQRDDGLACHVGVVHRPVVVVIPLLEEQREHLDGLGRQVGCFLAPGLGEIDLDGDEHELELRRSGNPPGGGALDIEREVDGQQRHTAALHAHARAYVEQEQERIELEEGVEPGVTDDAELVPADLQVEPCADLEGVGRDGHVGLEGDLEDAVVQLHRQPVHLAHMEAFLRLVGRVEAADGQQEALLAAPVQAEGHVAGDADADDLGIDDGGVEPHALLEVDAAGEIDIDPDDALGRVHAEGADDDDLRRGRELEEQAEVALDDGLETDLAQEAEEELTLLGGEVRDDVALHPAHLLRMLHEVPHEEHLVQGSGPHAALDGVAADLAVQADGSADGGQREAHAERDARMELGAQEHDQAEEMAFGGTRVAEEVAGDADLLEDVQGQHAEELAGILVDGDHAGALDGGSVHRDADAGRELEGGIQAEVAELSVFIEVIQDETDAQVLDRHDKGAGEVHLERGPEGQGQFAFLAFDGTGVQLEGVDGDGTQFLVVEVEVHVQPDIAAKVESLLEIVPQIGVEPEFDIILDHLLDEGDILQVELEEGAIDGSDVADLQLVAGRLPLALAGLLLFGIVFLLFPFFFLDPVFAQVGMGFREAKVEQLGIVADFHGKVLRVEHMQRIGRLLPLLDLAREIHQEHGVEGVGIEDSLDFPVFGDLEATAFGQ